MPAVRRRLFTFCSALSLLMCLAVCVMWTRSTLYGESGMSFSAGESVFGLGVSNGSFECGSTTSIPADSIPFRKGRWAGFGYTWGDSFFGSIGADGVYHEHKRYRIVACPA